MGDARLKKTLPVGFEAVFFIKSHGVFLGMEV
jgi:hypothetical protein